MPQNGCSLGKKEKKYSGDFKYFYITVSKYLCVSINDIIYHKLFYGIHNFDFTYRIFFFFSRNLMVLTFNPEKQLPLIHTYTVMQKRKLSQVLEAT